MALAKVQVVVPEATDSVEESSAECDLMIAALQRELNLIKSQLEHVVESTQAKSGGHGTVINKHLPPVVKKPPLPAVSKSVAQTSLSWEQQQHYINLVSQKEQQVLETRKQCLLLMEKHIIQQLATLNEKSKRLSRKLQQRLAKDKASKLAKIPIKTRSDISTTFYRPPFYRSTYYNEISNEHSLRVASSSKKSKKPAAAKRDKVEETIVEECKNEPSNSWAVTASAPVNYDTNEVKHVVAKRNISSCPPVLKPISALLGDKNNDEELKVRLHEAKMKRLTTTCKQLRHMFRLSQQHQRTSFIPNEFIEENDFNMLSEDHTTPAAVVRHEPATPILVAMPPISNSLSTITLASQKSLCSPKSPLSQSSPLPPLSLDAVLSNAPAIKESKKSCLWYNYNSIKHK